MIMRKLFHNITSRQGKFNQICARYGSSGKAVATNAQNKVILQTVTTTEELENGIIDWNTELNKIKQDENRSVLLPPTQEDDLQSFTPYLKQSFNFAAYVNKSKTLQELVKLGVDLSKLEKIKNVPDYILQLDYDKDIKNRIIYLNGLGVPMEELGKFLTKNPGFLKPRIWMQNRFKLLAKFDYIHNTMKISHKHILEMPEIFYAREFIIKQRDSFLRHLNQWFLENFGDIRDEQCEKLHEDFRALEKGRWNIHMMADNC
ncbi:transcription termination factor 3, mitochondrial-like [Ctenocephalides felis]|uniref:transcription termination factor 3, mitochondrial-like n=1 Tax=Ctenocephalides felis TaxID=7515 RepID=UPI000E6E3AA9|nr:transcription termination factor 3, mitochondrial-like [Ctenocephalides felis]